MCNLESWTSNRFNNFQKYNLQSGTWSAIALSGDLQVVRDLRVSFASVQEYLYCLVGVRFFFLDPATSTWVDSATQFSSTSVPSRRFAHGAVSMDNTLYIFGGFMEKFFDFKPVSDAFWGWNTNSRKWFIPASSGRIPLTRGFPCMFTAYGNIYLLWGLPGGQGDFWIVDYFGYNSMYPDLYKWVPSTGNWSVEIMSGTTPLPNQIYSTAASSNALLAVSRAEKRLYIMNFGSMTWVKCSNFKGDKTIFDIADSNSGHIVQALSIVSVKDCFVIAVLTSASSPKGQLEFLYHFDPTSNTMRILSDSLVASESSFPKFPKSYSYDFKYDMFYSNQKIYLFDNNPNNLIFPDTVERSFLANFDLVTNIWTENFQSSVVGNTQPYGRSFQSITVIGTKAYVFGGRSCNVDDGSGYANRGCNDIYVLPFPKAVEWPKSRADWLNLFDWDTLMIHRNGNYSFQENLRLCSVNLPCFVSVYGTPGKLHRSGDTGFVCYGFDGCIGVSIQNVIIVCADGIAQKSVIEFKGSSGFIRNSSFVKCASKLDGGALQILDSSMVTIFNSLFDSCVSERSGGAISVVGSSCLISGSNYINCTAMLSGGAIASKPFVCFPTWVPSTVHIDNSSFENCSTISGSGGCASLESGFGDISESNFYWCSSETNGGGIFVSGGIINLSFIMFMGCQSRGSGAAFSCANSNVSMEEVRFVGNTAQQGGGAAFIQDTVSSFTGISGFQNSAVTKGGGMILWTGKEPKFLCRRGSWADPTVPGKCIACEAGKFSPIAGAESNNCSPCQPGRYAAFQGMNSCIVSLFLIVMQRS